MLYNDDPEEMFKVHGDLAHSDSLYVSCFYVDIRLSSFPPGVIMYYNIILSCFIEFQIISVLKTHFLTGGPKRLKYTVPPLVVSALKV